MSHFTVLVVTKKEDEVGAALQPFHEFECTGTDDQYVQNVDLLAEAREKFAAATSTLVVKNPDGTKESAFDGTGSWKAKYRPFLDEDKRHLNLPEGYEELRNEPAKEHESFAEWASSWYGLEIINENDAPDLTGAHKYGWTRVKNGEVVEMVDRTNPNKKWDWWVLGGRWQGLLQVKAGAHSETGRKGLMGSDSGRGGVDACWKRDLDIDAMKAKAVAEHQKSWDETIAKAREAGLTKTEAELDELRRAYYRKKEAEREAWMKNRGDRREHYHTFMGDFAKLDDVFGDFMRSRTTEDDVAIKDWIAGAAPFQTFAVLKDGQWYQSGEMGWWGVVHNEKDGQSWDQEYAKLIEDLPDDSWLAIVDCHI